MTPPRGTRLIATLVTLAALGSVAWAAAPLVWHLTGADTIVAPAPPAPAPVAAEPAPPSDIGPILALAPFGSATPAPEPEAPVGVTALDLTLLGVILRDDPAASRALIADGADDGYFRPGDEIRAGVTLSEVFPAHVSLDVEGRTELLYFPDGGPEIVEMPTTPEGVDALLAALRTDYVPPVSRERAAPETTQDYIALWRRRIIANPAQVLEQIGLEATENGYRIAEQHDSGVALAGLRAGDLVRTVNGQPVGDVDSDRRLFDEVAASGLARLEIERDGETIVMSFPLE